MIIKTTDFQLGAYIPNRDDAPNSDIIGNEPILQGFIDTEVEQILVKLLGYDLFIELDTNITNGDLDPGADQKWKDLVNGKESYRGLKGLLVSWVFAKFLENDNEDYSTQGVSQNVSEGSERVRPSRKIISEYKKFYEQSVGGYGNGPSVYRKQNGVAIIWGYNTSKSGYKSLFQFLSENGTVYETWQPAGMPKQMNHYDI